MTEHMTPEEFRRNGYAAVDWVANYLETSADRPVLSQAKPGDIAVHNNIDPWDLRIVANTGGRYISLVRLEREKGHIDYTPEHITVASILQDVLDVR